MLLCDKRVCNYDDVLLWVAGYYYFTYNLNIHALPKHVLDFYIYKMLYHAIKLFTNKLVLKSL